MASPPPTPAAPTGTDPTIPPTSLRRTRFVCISDTHNTTVRLPKGDVLIHAGDLTNQGSFSELSRAVRWLEYADFEAKIVVAGNHDITLDQAFYSRHGREFHNQDPQSHDVCLALLAGSPSVSYLCHSSVTVRLSSPAGPRTRFTVFGSPYSPHTGEHGTARQWAFGYDAPQPGDPNAQMPRLWDAVPLAADVVVTHTPPRGHCDGTTRRGPVGCEALRRALWRVRPRLAVCGHTHEGRGAECVRWAPGSPDSCEEEGVEPWADPGAGNGRISLVDLTGRRKESGWMLDNDGGNSPETDGFGGGGGGGAGNGAVGREESGGADEGVGRERQPRDPDPPPSPSPRHPKLVIRDQDAPSGRTGRRETCVVNCAIAANSYPHVGGKKFHKPIVVDLYLPVWDDG